MLPLQLIVAAILLAAPFALWGAVCALSQMNIRTTRPPIAVGFFCRVIGWGGLIFAGIDFLTGAQPLFWPILLLLAVLMLAIGDALIYLFNRRTCSCPACPGRVTDWREAR